MESSRQCVLNAYAREVIRHKARQLIGKYGFTNGDYEDLEQEMALDLLMRLSKFDPSKASLNTFVARIVDRKISNLIRYRKQEKRDYQREARSLDEPIEVENGAIGTFGDAISQDDHDLRTGRHDRPDAERHDLHLDLSLAISELPPELRSLARRLVRQTVAEAARDLGVSRATLYDTGIARLRKAFEDKGLSDYL